MDTCRWWRSDRALRLLPLVNMIPRPFPKPTPHGSQKCAPSTHFRRLESQVLGRFCCHASIRRKPVATSSGPSSMRVDPFCGIVSTSLLGRLVGMSQAPGSAHTFRAIGDQWVPLGSFSKNAAALEDQGFANCQWFQPTSNTSGSDRQSKGRVANEWSTPMRFARERLPAISVGS